MTAPLPGDIGAVAKVDEIHFDAVLHDSHDEDHIHLQPLEFPTPMHGLAIEPKRRGDEQRISEVLHKMVGEDPTPERRARRRRQRDRDQRAGRAAPALAARAPARAQYKLEVSTRPPRIAVPRDDHRATAEGHHRHKKQTGGAGQFGEVFLRVEPLARGARLRVRRPGQGRRDPDQFIPAVREGRARRCWTPGAIAGYPVQDVRVIVYDGKHHPVDCKEIAFVTAGRKAFLDAIREGAADRARADRARSRSPRRSTTMGDITGDLSSRRGQVTGTGNLAGGMMLVQGVVPLSELDGYQAGSRR